jgi:hypothetical protein
MPRSQKHWFLLPTTGDPAEWEPTTAILPFCQIAKHRNIGEVGMYPRGRASLGSGQRPKADDLFFKDLIAAPPGESLLTARCQRLTATQQHDDSEARLVRSQCCGNRFFWVSSTPIF